MCKWCNSTMAPYLSRMSTAATLGSFKFSIRNLNRAQAEGSVLSLPFDMSRLNRLQVRSAK